MSQAQIGNLMVQLGINTAQFAAGLASAQGTLASFSKGLKAFAASAAATLSLGAIGMAIKSSIDHMDELGKAAQKIGIPVEQLSKLEYAASLADVSLEDLTGTLAKFSKNVTEIAGGGQNDAGQALKALGISATDANGKLRPTIELFGDIADQFATMKDSAAKTALAIALFGKSGASMIPLLNGGREAIRAAGAELEQFGGVVTQEAADQAQDYNDKLTSLNRALNSLLQQALIPILPTLTDFTQAIIDMTKTGSDVRQFIEDVAGWLDEWGPSLQNTKREIEGITSMLEYLGLIAKRPLEIDIPGGDLAVGPPKPKPKPTRDAPILPNLEAIKKKLEEARKEAEKANKQIADLFDQGQEYTNSVSPLARYQDELRKLNDVYNAGAISSDTYYEVVKQLQDEFSDSVPVVNELGDAFINLQDGISATFSDAFVGLISGTESVKQAFQSMTQSISQMMAQLAAELIKSGILKLLSMLAGSMGGFTIGGASFGGFYADGGTLGSGKWGIAGEAGPELVKGPASITPMDKLGGQSPQMNVTVINNSGASVSTRKNSKGDLEVMVEDMIAEKLIRGGNKIDAALARGYGLRRSGRS